jgi:fido (protein-threonine AMPylation protein)
MYDAIEDPYTYKNSTVLVNKLDLQNQAELDAFEAEISSARAEEPLPGGSMDFEHYKAIHHHLFQDVYDWAGQVRRSSPSSPCWPTMQATRSKIEKLNPDEMLAAMIASFDGDERRLADVIYGLTE